MCACVSPLLLIVDPLFPCEQLLILCLFLPSLSWGMAYCLLMSPQFVLTWHKDRPRSETFTASSVLVLCCVWNWIDRCMSVAGP